MEVGITTITPKWQITIPADVRALLDWKTKDKIMVMRTKGTIKLKRLERFEDLFGSVKPRKRPEDWKEVRRETQKWVAERAVKRGRLKLPAKK